MASLTETRAKDFQALQDEMFNVVMDRWVELNFSTDNWSESTEGVCTNRVRQIGEQLHRAGGGNNLMFVARHNIAKRLGVMDSNLQSVFNTEINWVWNGIGEWQA
jgi:hypothetical protein